MSFDIGAKNPTDELTTSDFEFYVYASETDTT